MKALILVSILSLLLSCSGSKSSVSKNSNTSSSNKGAGDTRTSKVEYIDENTYLLTDLSADPTYGYTQNNPVKVGGVKQNEGPLNERRFLNGLLGPEGQKVMYFRAGSCCSFPTPNGYINNAGLLDKYRVYWKGGKDTVNIYINMYDFGDLQVPVGFTAKSRF